MTEKTKKVIREITDRAFKTDRPYVIMAAAFQQRYEDAMNDIEILKKQIK